LYIAIQNSLKSYEYKNDFIVHNKNAGENLIEPLPVLYT